MVRSFFEREFWRTVIFQSIDSSAGFNMVNVTVAKKLEAEIRGWPLARILAGHLTASDAPTGWQLARLHRA